MSRDGDSGGQIAVACAHNDLLLELAAFRSEVNPFAERWLPKLEAGGVVLQLCPVYVDVNDLPELALRRALEQVAAFHRAVDENADRVVHVLRAADLDLVESGEKIGLILALEGAEPLGNDVTLADVFFKLGVRSIGLTWMRRNAFADGNLEPAGGGLSVLGRKLVRRLTELGMVIDLAHASDTTFADVLDSAPSRPLLVSHGACRALKDSPRNVPDHFLSALAERGGLFGVMCHPFALGTGATIATVGDHIEHALSVGGAGCVALGGDFTWQLARSGAVAPPRDVELPPGMGLDAAVERLAGPEDYQGVAEELRCRGHSHETVAGIMGQNLLRFLRSVLPARA